jgi:hypothetical protein
MVLDVFAETGAFTPPSVLQRTWWFVESNRILVLPLAALLLMLGWRRISGKSAVPSRSVAPVYAPPEGLTPAECGTLIDDNVAPRDITATLVDLAGRGYIRIEDAPPQPGLHLDRRDFVFRLLKPKAEWQELAPHEEMMLFHTFYGGQWTMLSSLRLRFPEIVPLMRAQILLSLRQKGMYRMDPMQARLWSQAGLGVVAVLLLELQPLAGVEMFASPLLAGLMIALSALIVFLLGRGITTKTTRGMKAYVTLLGLQDFIQTVDADRLQRLEADTFDKLLPYAMALGIEHKLAHAFAGLAAPPPWYSRTEGEPFDLVGFGHRMNLLTLGAQVLAAAASRR